MLIFVVKTVRPTALLSKANKDFKRDSGRPTSMQSLTVAVYICTNTYNVVNNRFSSI